MTTTRFGPDPRHPGWDQLALVLTDPPAEDQPPAERRLRLRVLLAECRAIGRQQRHDRRTHRNTEERK